MTPQQKVRDIGKRLGIESRIEPNRLKQHCMTLMRDAVRWTDVDQLDNESLLGFMTLATMLVEEDKVNKAYYLALRKNLMSLRFQVTLGITDPKFFEV